MASVVTLALYAPASLLPAQEKYETILDRIVHIDTTLHTMIPPVFRWCDSLALSRRRINVGDCTIFVEEEGNGFPLVLINGGPGGTHHGFHPWFGEAGALARVIYYDQRGCGLSDYTPGVRGYSVEQATDDLEALRRALNVDRWVMLGFSYGGFLAQYYTLRYPEHVAGMILVGAEPRLIRPMGSSRQGLFLSDQERDRMRAIAAALGGMMDSGRITPAEFTALTVYNNHLNGDWKRQHYRRPSPERLAQIARYEWAHDADFNGIMNESEARFDLTGAFTHSPIPTLILEGKWDLTWSEQKRDILKANHPNARMVVFEHAGHAIYDEEPGPFFVMLKDFITTLRSVNPDSLARFKNDASAWEREQLGRPRRKPVGWGRASSVRLAQEYRRGTVEHLTDWTAVLRLGFAQYDMKNYEEAFLIFKALERISGSDAQERGVALIWQGQMLDLLGRRPEAVRCYQTAAEMNLTDRQSHGQYGLSFEISPYARKRMTTPFERIENGISD